MPLEVIQHFHRVKKGSNKVLSIKPSHGWWCYHGMEILISPIDTCTCRDTDATEATSTLESQGIKEKTFNEIRFFKSIVRQH